MLIRNHMRAMLLAACLLFGATAMADETPATQEFDLTTYEGQVGFFDAQWPNLRSAMETGGADAAAAFIAGFDDPLQRRVLYLYTNTGLVMREWEVKNLDGYIALCERGKAELLAQADAAPDEETRAARINVANMLYYNLAADLADCWPDDGLKRERRHFEAGLKAAQQCIAWREELSRPAANKSTAWWAAGMHQLSLGMYADAQDSFTRSLEYAQEDASAQGKDAELGAGSTFAVILGEGYLALAELKVAQEAERDEAMARAHYNAALAAFTEQLETPGLKDDAQFGLDQLATVWERYEGK